MKDQQSTTPPEKSATPNETKPAEPPKDAKAPVVPDKYEFKAPEGQKLNDAVITEATPVLKELGISQEGATKLYDIFTKHGDKSIKETIAAYESMRGDWRKEIIADKTMGNSTDGLSAEANQNIDAAFKALPPEIQQPLRDAFNFTGAGDHPAVVRAMNFFGKGYREGTAVQGANPSPLGQRAPGARPQSAAQAMYPNLPSSNSAS